MDILNCELLWIDGRCYRKLSSTASIARSESNVQPERKPCGYEDEPGCVLPKAAALRSGSNESISGQAKGFFRISLHVPQKFLPVICGTKHATRMKMEQETSTAIRIPPADSTDDIEITGTTEGSIESACLRIRSIMSRLRQRECFTHFICLPFNMQPLANYVEEFKETVLKTCSGRGLEASLFQSRQKLHLTVGMLVLLDNKECSEAKKVLDSCGDIVKEILGGQSLYVRVSGLEFMNDDATEVDVLYAKVTTFDSNSRPNDKLQQLVDQVARRFAQSGLMLEQPHNVKLHITLMNTKFREVRFATENTAEPPARTPRVSFDASNILKRNRDFHFGKVTVPSINIVVPHTCNKEGFYESLATLPLPKHNYNNNASNDGNVN
ncbi:putative activating signal cointegrator 1 complex subunit [Ixodes scapularis]